MKTKKPKPKCSHHPKREGPVGYIQWHEWSQKRVDKGWTQKMCKACGLYFEWIKPKPNEKDLCCCGHVRDDHETLPGSRYLGCMSMFVKDKFNKLRLYCTCSRFKLKKNGKKQ